MAKTAAQRQAEYRARRPYAGQDGNGERRLNTWVSTRAYHALERVARHTGVTKREILEQLLVAEDDRILSGMDLDSPEWERYFTKRPVTP